MPVSSNGGRNGGSKKKDTPMMDNLRGACPPHKMKDLDKLVKQMKGDEAKIMEKIQEWWEEPVIQGEEEKWEDVNKKSAKKKPIHGGGSGGGVSRGGRSGGGGGKSGRGRDRGGGRGDRTVRDRQGRGPRNDKRQASPMKAVEDIAHIPSEDTNFGAASTSPSGLPALSSPQTLKGAWGAGAPGGAAQDPSSAEDKTNTITDEPSSSVAASNPEMNPLESFPMAPQIHQDRIAVSHVAAEPHHVSRVPVPPGGNVWATKGSAHLIRAEKQLPFPVSVSAPAPVEAVEPDSTNLMEESDPCPSLETGLPAGIPTGGTAWTQPSQPTQPSPDPEPPSKPIDVPTPQSPVVSINVPPPPTRLPQTEVVMEKAPEPVPAPSPAVQKVLNMGHWETGGDDPSDIDFGFGFGAGTNDVHAPTPAPKESIPSATTSTTTTTGTSTVSPARPPPGLSISGMPPMPASAVMVHELENKLESSSLGASQKTDSPSAASGPSSIPGGQPNAAADPNPTQGLPSAMSQQNYSQHYGMQGMYNYNAAAAAGSGFVGIPAPVLTGGIIPQQPGKPQIGGLAGPSQVMPSVVPHQGLYRAQPTPATETSNMAVESSTVDTPASSNAPSSGVPPGMPSSIPYANPAMHYGQHQFYMGQHQGGIGYNYGYGQFGAVPQGSFGYQQAMGHNQGYGAPHYDDQGHQGNSHHSSSSGYQTKGGGAYRGRNSHHSNNNQYQNQYNHQQHSGYGGQPYSMGYHGHGPGGMADPYGMQHQGGMSGGFQDDDHQTGRKGGRGGHNSFQQGPPQLSGQQTFGLQAQSGVDSAPSSGVGGGWSNQSGGWSGSGQSGWQGN